MPSVISIKYYLYVCTRQLSKVFAHQTFPKISVIYLNLGTCRSQREKFSGSSRLQNLKLNAPISILAGRLSRESFDRIARYLHFRVEIFAISVGTLRHNLPCRCAIKYCSSSTDIVSVSTSQIFPCPFQSLKIFNSHIETQLPVPLYYSRAQKSSTSHMVYSPRVGEALSRAEPPADPPKHTKSFGDVTFPKIRSFFGAMPGPMRQYRFF